MNPKDLKTIKLTFDKSLYNRKYSLIPLPESYKPLREMTKFRQQLKLYRQNMIERLPANLKMIEISPMTKAMIGMVVSVLAMA